MDEWKRNLTALWNRATTAVGGWGLWRVDPHEASYNVVSHRGTVVAVTAHKDVADLIASLPDLLEPSLRPGNGTSIGISDPDMAHEQGWQEGYDVGTAEAYADADTLVREMLDYFSRMTDADIQAVVKAATEHWTEITEGLPTHEGEADPYHPGGGDGPRPVC